MAPVLTHLPEQRLRQVSLLTVRGILAAQSPVLTGMARGGQPEDGLNWPLAKRFYRFVANPRFDHRALLKGLYGLAQQAVARDPRPYLVVAIDPVNFEKPYTVALEGVSTVLKSTPPGPKGEKRLTPGYPAITATIVNLPEPVITYANWFSYRTADFISENQKSTGRFASPGRCFQALNCALSAIQAWTTRRSSPKWHASMVSSSSESSSMRTDWWGSTTHDSSAGRGRNI